MKKFCILILFIIFIVGCGNSKKTAPSYTNVSRMELLQHTYFTINQIDSVIVADSLNVFDTWHKNVLYNDETGDKIEQRLYMKKCNDSTTVSYSTRYSNTTNAKYEFKKIMYIDNGNK